MTIKKFLSIIDFFLPLGFIENFSSEALYRSRGFIGSSVVSLVTFTTYFILGLVFGIPTIIKVAFLINSVFCICLLLYFKFSHFQTSVRVRHPSMIYLIYLLSIVTYSIYFNLGLGFFAIIWLYPIIVYASFLFEIKNYIFIFLVMLSLAIFLSVISYENFFDTLVTNSHFKQVYLFYFFASFITVFGYLLNRAALDKAIFIDNYELAQSTTRYAKYFALENITSKLAHDINNPLFVIQGKIHTLRNLNSSDQNAIDALMIDIENSIYNLSNNLKKISAFSKDGRMVQMAVVELDELVKETINDYNVKLKEKNIIVEIYVEEKLSLICFPSYVREILKYLIESSMESFETGILNDSLKNVIKIIANMNGQWVKIQFMNNGELLSDEYINKIFKADFNNKNSKSSSRPGLTIAHGLVGLQDGNLLFKRENKFNVFTIELPSYEEDEEETDEDGSMQELEVVDESIQDIIFENSNSGKGKK